MTTEALAAEPPPPSWIESFLETAMPEQPLYHYTDQNGLLGILNSKEIWATSYHFLNDTSEFKHAKEIAKELIEQKRRRGGAPAVMNLLRFMDIAVESSGINLYVSSWSEASDDLSQWRAYGGDRTGYELGIAGNDLAAIAHANDFVLVRCLYEEDQKREKMKAVLQKAQEELEAILSGNDAEAKEEAKVNGGPLAYYLNRCACAFKDKTFAAEREWRLISKPTSLRAKAADVRTGRSTLIPFFKLRATIDNSDAIAINSIRVGPCPDPENAMLGARALWFRHNNGHGHLRVERSQIPYRNW